MGLYPQILYGFEVVAGANDTLDWENNSVVYSATLAPGLYCPDSLASAMQTAMRVVDPNNPTVTFDYVATKYTFGNGVAAFQLLFSSGTNHAKTCANLFEFAANADQTLATSYTSSAVGTVWSGGQIAPGSSATGSIWTLAEPVQSYSPVTAQAGGTTALLLQREIRALQNKSDGGSLETVYLSSFKRFRVRFDQLLSGNVGSMGRSEQTSMEAFLDWALQGKSFSYQPDSTSTNTLHLVLEIPGRVEDSFSWPTRPEVSYGELVFIQQL